jgi:penicillin amidase
LRDDFDRNANFVFSQYFKYGYRAERIVEMIENFNPQDEDAEKHTIDTFQQIQGDNKSISAEEITPFLRAIQFEDQTLNELRNWMLDWDFQMNMDSPQAALYANFWRRLVINIYQDQLGTITDIIGDSQQMWATFLLLRDPINEWWDDVNTPDFAETRDDILRRSFIEAQVATFDALGDNRDDWQWGNMHTETFVSNPLGMSGIGLIENTVNVGPVPTGGGSAVVNATAWDFSEGDLAVQAVPALRMIIDLEDFANSVSMHTTGQSGHPFSDHYSDMVDSWRNIDYHTMLWTREQVEDAAENVLRLQPME